MESLTMAEGGVSNNENGESKKVSITEEEKPDVATIRRKMLEESNLADKIDNFMDENDMECIRHVQEAEKCIHKLEQSQQKYRSLHKELIHPNRWTIHRSAFHTDISKMYNTIQLRREHWVFEQYLWENSLDPAKQCQDKVIKTIISRVHSSRSQAERALRMTTEISRCRYPQIYEIISRHIYVDCIQRMRCST